MTPRKQIFEGSIDTITLCCELVRIPSLTSKEGDAAEWVFAKMRDMGFSDVRVDPFGNVIGVWQGKNNGPTLLFDAHLDVAPVEEPERWRHSPFSGPLDGGRIWGCGSADTKASLAAMLSAVSGLPGDG